VPAPWFPELPAFAPRVRGTTRLRYEDVAQDGRVAPAALSHAIGDIVWRETLAHDPVVMGSVRSGVLPILTRLVIETGDEPVPVHRPLEGEGLFQLAHDVDENGAVDRLFLHVWATLQGARGRTNFPAGPGDGEPVAVGRVFAEHVFTRPFAAPADRKVKALDGLGVPEARVTFRPLPRAADLPPGARLLDEVPVVDEAPVVFGLAHTDSNQHVNSLVYLRLFEEAFLRRLSARGVRASVLLRWLEIGYRKPCFAGDRVRVRLSLWERGGEVGAVGAIVPEHERDTDRPYAWLAAGGR
jgi:hypothetical protein